MQPSGSPDIDRQLVQRLAEPFRRLAWLGVVLLVTLVVPGWLLSWAGITDGVRLPVVPSVILFGWLGPLCVWIACTPSSRFTVRRTRLFWWMICSAPGLIGLGHMMVQPAELAAMVVDLPLALTAGGVALSATMLDGRLSLALGVWCAVQFAALSFAAVPHYAAVEGPALLLETLRGDGAIARRVSLLLVFGALAALVARTFRRAYISLFDEQAARAEEARLRALAEQERHRVIDESAAKTRFLGALSHEIRTPLHALGAHAARLDAADDLTAAHRRSARVVADSSRHLLDILESALDTARDDAGHSAAAAADFDIRALIAEVIALFSARAEDAGLGLFGAVADDVPEIVRGVRPHWRQVLVNLVSNGLKYTASGRVDVRASRADDRLVLTVRDTGAGMTDASRAVAFGDFVRGADDDAPGHGLGLAITRDLVKRMGGTITLESAVGQGTVVRVMVALPDPPVADAVAVSKALPPAAIRRTLRELAVRGDMGGIARVLHDIDDPELASFTAAVRSRADAFDDDGIIALLDGVQEDGDDHR